MMNKQKGWRIAAAVLAGLLLLFAFVIQLAGGRGPLPDWQQLRAALGVPLRTEESVPKPAPGSTAVYVLDVGQGDAVLICQDGAYCLIDTGPAEAEDALLYDLHALDVESLDYLVLTHPHVDHTGNARAVLSDFPVKQLLLPLWEPGADDTADWPRQLAESAAENGTELITAEAGDRYPLGGGTAAAQGGQGVGPQAGGAGGTWPARRRDADGSPFPQAARPPERTKEGVPTGHSLLVLLIKGRPASRSERWRLSPAPT